MSTRLEQAQRDYQDGKLHINEHQKIIIAERNKEILGLQQRLREADERIRQLESSLRQEAATTEAEAVQILRVIDSTGTLHRHDIALDALVANFLNRLPPAPQK